MKEKSLELVVTIPDDMTDEEVVNHLKAITLAADEYHRSLGGCGLKVKSLEITGTIGQKCGKCQKNDAQSMHTCPYSEEINGDSTTLCDCCDECQHECCMEI